MLTQETDFIFLDQFSTKTCLSLFVGLYLLTYLLGEQQNKWLCRVADSPAPSSVFYQELFCTPPLDLLLSPIDLDFVVKKSKKENSVNVIHVPLEGY